MYLKRKTDLFLESWKQTPDRKPLIIKGARQIGKTETIRRFAEKHYQSIIEINFALMPNYRVITTDGYTVDAVNRAISRLNPSVRLIPHETLLFFDEIQDHPDIATCLKSYAQDGRYDVICSGSLLGLYYKSIESNSIGYKTDYLMRSMDFEEFLWANGYEEDISNSLLDALLSGNPLPEATMQAMNARFLDHFLLGGMPAVVRSFVESGTFSGTADIQRQLILDYEEDIMKYADGMDQTRILNVFRHIPVQLARENKKFQITKVADGARYKDYRGAIEWLQNAGIINTCYCLHFPELPLKGNYDETKYKIYMADTGLLLAMLDEETLFDLRSNKNLRTYKGGLYENIISEILVKSGCDLYYFKRNDSTLEEDFFLRTPENIVPVEVKSTNGNSKSLRTLIDSDHYPEIRFGIKLADTNIRYANGIYTFPHFTAFLLRRYLREKFMIDPLPS